MTAVKIAKNSKPLHYNIIGAVLMLMMIIPFKFQWVKLSLILLCLFYAYSKKSVYYSKSFQQWTILYLICNVVPFMLGVIYGNPGYIYYIATYFLWPVLYYMLFRTINLGFYDSFHKWVKIGTWAVLVTGLFVFTYYNAVGPIEDGLLSVKPMIRPGLPFISIQDGCVSSIIFLYSYIIVYSLLNKEKNVLLLVACFVFIFITSRRIIYAELILAILLYFIIAKYCHIPISRKVVRVFIIAFIIIIAIALYIINYFGFFELADMITFFEETSETSDSYRVDQFNALIKGWQECPLFGNGTGIDASIARSPTPGTYELTYVALLFERGIIGIMVYIFLLLFLNTRSLLVLKRYPSSRKYLLPILVSLDMILVANATNPYTNAFDYMWMLFIIFPLLNTRFYEKGLRSSPSVQ